MRETLILTLDSAEAPFDVGKLSTEALRLVDNKFSLVRTVVEWSSTIFRASKTRIYIAVRLLRHWQRRSIDIDAPILDILADSRGQQNLHVGHLFQLISELARSRSFAVGRYLQWLMARGALNDNSAKSQRWDIQLLSELPQHRLPKHVWNLRNTLLTRAGISDSSDIEAVGILKAYLSSRLPLIFNPSEGTIISSDQHMPDLQGLNWSVKSEIGQWIRKHVSSHYKAALGNAESKSTGAESDVSALTADEFCILREILEQFEDVSMLADILHDACNAEDVTVLASVADTVSYHFDSLAAIGAHNDLYQSLLETYRQIKTAELPTGGLITSLVDLGKHLPSEAVSVNYLRQELSRSYQNNATAAFSPVSDHMAGNLQFADMNFLDEFEQFLGTGTRMDEENMLKSFETLSERLVATEDFESTQSARLNHLLSQLRTYNEKQFDSLMIKWVAGLVTQNAKRLERIIPPLIGTGCLTFEALFSITKTVLGSTTSALLVKQPGPRIQLFNLTLTTFKAEKSPPGLVSTSLT
jgi:mediator of RNA polymerase II transcription subunit 12, fungi type